MKKIIIISLLINNLLITWFLCLYLKLNPLQILLYYIEFGRNEVVFKFAFWEKAAEWHLLGVCTLMRCQRSGKKKSFKFTQKWIDYSYTRCHLMRRQGRWHLERLINFGLLRAVKVNRHCSESSFSWKCCNHSLFRHIRSEVLWVRLGEIECIIHLLYTRNFSTVSEVFYAYCTEITVKTTYSKLIHFI